MNQSAAKLRNQVTLVMILGLLMVWWTAVYELHRSEQAAIHEAELQTATEAHVFAEFAQSNIKRLNELLLDLRPQWDGKAEHFAPLVLRHQENLGDLAFQVAVIDRQGLLAFSNLAKPNDRTDLSQREHFRVHAEAPGVDRLFISKPLKGKVSGKWSIQFTRPIFKDGVFDGVPVISVSPELFAKFSEKLHLRQDNILSIVRDTGEIMVRYPILDSSYGQVISNRPYLAADAPVSGNNRAVATVDGIERIYGYYKLKDYGMSFVIGEALHDVMAPYYRYRNMVLGLATVISALALFFWVTLSRSLAGIERLKFQLEHSKVQAESANLAKSQFLAMMSHEIRTPMNGVIGMTELLLDDRDLNEQQLLNLKVISNSAHSLLSIINDVLDFSKIEAGKLELESMPFDLRELLAEVGKLYAVRASEKSLVLVQQIDAAVPQWIQGDPTRLRQILGNFLSNAVKFTLAGEIDLAVRVLHADGTQCRLRFEVRDSGIGIPPEVQARIFSPFTQADTSTTRKFGGTGLGLSICKQLAGLMYGDIGVSSVMAEGTTFWVELPFALAEPQVHAAVGALPDGGLVSPAEWRILLAEDNPINQMVALKLCRKLGIENVAVANNGQEVLDKLVAQPFDIVLMDCQMPVMDGYEATTQLRALGFDLPVVAMTANAMKGDREKCLAVGMNDYVSKPISLSDLKSVLERWPPLRLHAH